jgi:hypothetical protein
VAAGGEVIGKDDGQPHAQAAIAHALAPRCLARGKRTGKPCQSPAMPNGRCRMHGGKSPGPPKGNRNAWKHGVRSAEAIRLRRAVNLLARVARGERL